MARVLTLDEMLEAIGPDDKTYEMYETALVQIAQQMAEYLSLRENIDVSDVSSQPGFGGTCATFYASKIGQPLPECFQHLDVCGEWETIDGDVLNETTGRKINA